MNRVSCLHNAVFGLVLSLLTVVTGCGSSGGNSTPGKTSLPDLTVTITALTLGTCSGSGCTVLVDYDVANLGAADAGPFDILIEGNPGFSPITIPVPGGLTAGSLASFSDVLGPGGIANVAPTVDVAADSGLVIAESDESNNSDSQTCCGTF